MSLTKTVILSFLSLFAGEKTEDSVGTPLNVVKAEKGTVKEVYNSTGTVESENTKTYYSPVTAPIKECRAVVGQTVKAGDLLGFMGDTGYGTREGTKGKFPVHLHLGIYIDSGGEEVSVNPYPALKYLESKRLDFKTG